MKTSDKTDLTKFFDKVEVDIKADLSDWHKVRRELRSVKLPSFFR